MTNLHSGGVLYRTIRVLTKPLFKVLYRVHAEGADAIPSEGPVIVVANHVSFMDSLWIPSVFPRRMYYLAKAQYFESWKTSWLFKALGMIPVARGVKSKTDEALEAGLGVLSQQGVLGLYPEGTRSPDGRLYRGRTGVARLVLRARASVIPVGLLGSREVMPKEAKLPRLWGKVTVKIGNPLNFERYFGSEEDRFVLRTMTDEIMFEIMNLTGQTYHDEYASKEADEPIPEDFILEVDEMLG